MKIKILFLVFFLFLASAPIAYPGSPADIGHYSNEILRSRQNSVRSGYTSTRILERRLAKLALWPRVGQPLALRFEWGDTHYQLGWPGSREFLSHPVRRTAGSVDIPDMLVNEEMYPSSFNQSEPSVCMLPDLRFVTVWEEERNGDIDIFAQKYTFTGNPEGNNLEVGEEDFPRDQFLPCVSLIDDTSLVLVWVDEQNFEIYGKRLSKDLAPVGQAFLVSDSPMPFTTWSPAVASGPDGKFVVVWADTRSGNNIYARIFDSAGNPLGASFKVNGDDGSKLHASPQVSVGRSGNFVIVWEDFRNNDADIYAQRFDFNGTKLGGNVLVNLDSLDEDQYTPSVNVGVNDRLMVSWVDLRWGNEAVFARSLSFADPLGDTVLFAVSSDTSSVTQESPPTVSDTLGRFTIAWTEYTAPNPTIYAQKFDSLGQMVSDTITVSNLQSISERHGLCLSASPGGSFVAAWMDRQAGNFDIYVQRVNSSGFLQGGSLLLNDDDMGANQNLPGITVKSDGGFVAVWEDMRRSCSDIFMKRFDYLGQALGDDFMVNDSLGRIYHGKPDLASDSSGNFVVVWEDARDNDLNVYAQLFDLAGNPNGGNFKVNCEGMNNSSSPCCDVSPGGSFVVVWSSADGITKSIYGRLFSSEGEPLDTCFRINDDTLSVDHLSPRVAVDTSGGFVVAWEDKREGQARIYLQRFASDGSKVDTNFAVYSDGPDPVQYDADLDLNPEGDFVVTWTELYLSSTMIFAQRYDASDTPVDTNMMVVDDPLASPANAKVKLASDFDFVIVWEDFRNQASDIYFQTFLGGLPEGSNRKLNTDPDHALQFFPDIGLQDPYLYSVWTDNRIPGWGFSIFFNQVNYIQSAVDEQENQESSPEDFVLHQNYPNPFNPSTTIRYVICPEMIRGSNRLPVRVTLKVFNVLGQMVRTLVNEEKYGGTYRIAWDGKDDGGTELCSGIYFYRLRVKDRTWIRKMLYLK